MESTLADRHDGKLLIAAGCVPFALGGAFAVAGGNDEGIVFCPFRLITGLPCPLCGGTRAFAYAASGDTKFLSYNGFWVFVALAVILSGILMAFTRVPVRRFWQRSRLVPVMVIALLFAGGWAWSLTNQTTILG